VVVPNYELLTHFVHSRINITKDKSAEAMLNIVTILIANREHAPEGVKQYLKA